MCKKSKIRCGGLIYLTSFVLVLGLILTRAADAADPSLVGWWKFDESSGTKAFDSSGNNYHGTVTGAEWVTGQLGGALNVTGSTVTVPPEAWSSIEKQVTVAFWAYGDPVLLPQRCHGFTARQGSLYMSGTWFPYDGSVYWDAGNLGDTERPWACDRISKAVTAEEIEGSWQHWTFTKDADTGEMKIYLNGVLWHSGSGFTRPMTGVTAFTIGCRPGPTEYYVGMMDDFRLYDYALSLGEVAWLAGRTEPFDKPF